MPILISKNKNLIGSVVYEEVGTDDMVLEFYSTKLGQSYVTEEEKEKLEYPQSPLSQEWIIDYPLLAYKHFAPDNHKLCIINLAQDVP